MITLAFALALLAPQDTPWPFFGGTADGDVGIAVDPASIESNGALRRVRGRMTKVGEDNRYILIDLRVDCAARTAVITHAIGYQDGQPIATQPTVPPEGFPMTDDPSSPPLIAYLCPA